MIRILTGPIRSYKTTTLLQWSSARDHVGGVLSPDVDGIRHLYNVKERIFIPWQKEWQTDERDLVIGRFVFDHVAFTTAIGWLNDHLQNDSVSTIILDEIGPLELQGKGWNEWLQRSLHLQHGKDLVLVVRENIVSDVIKQYQLGNPQVVGKEDFAL